MPTGGTPRPFYVLLGEKDLTTTESVVTTGRNKNHAISLAKHRQRAAPNFFCPEAITTGIYVAKLYWSRLCDNATSSGKNDLLNLAWVGYHKLQDYKAQGAQKNDTYAQPPLVEY